MKLYKPFRISSRLMPGVRFGYLDISLDIDGHDPDGRTRYHYVIESGDMEFEATDLRSGCQGGTVAEGFASLLAFLEAAGEAYLNHRNGHISENSGMFPEWVEELAHHYSDELAALRLDLEETPESFIEE
jgi:hypothetical protein